MHTACLNEADFKDDLVTSKDRALRCCRTGAASLAVACCLLLGASAPAAEWQALQETSDGIRIFAKEDTASGLIEFRGEGMVDAPLGVVATVIFDMDRRLRWVKGLAETRIVRWEGRDTFVEYDHIDMPTFFTDRDFVSKIRIHADPARGEMTFRYQTIDDPAVPPTAYLRGEVIHMRFLLRSADNGARTHMDAEFLCDPKGWIPRWLVNFFLKDWPKTTFRNLRKEATRGDVVVDPRFAGQPGPPDRSTRRGSD